MAKFYQAARRERAQQENENQDDHTHRLVAALQPTSAAAEAFRTLRTNLLYSFVDAPPRVLVVTSPGIREGKSTTCANLGWVLAQADENTLLVDCDFRKPTLHKIFGLRNIRGIVNVLAEEYKVQDVWHEPQPGLKVVTVGQVPPNPAELLGSKRYAQFLDEVRQDFDRVLIDASPIGLVSDPAVLASQGDGVLLVFDAQKTRKAALRRSVRSLNTVSARIIGTVMNSFEMSEAEHYYYGDYGYRSK